MNSKRIEWIVSLRALAALVVVLIHVPFGWLGPIGGGLGCAYWTEAHT